MSEATAEGAPAENPDAVELPPQGDAAFGALMDALAPEQDSEKPEGAGAEAGAAAGASGSAAAPAEGTGPDGKPAQPSADGNAGKQGVPGDGQPAEAAAAGSDTGGRTAPPADWTATAEEFAPRFGELSTALEDKMARAYHAESVEEVKKEHAKYFEAISVHPRTLVGKEVPALSGEGTEKLRDSADAKEWQEAIKETLLEEVRSRATVAMENNSEFLNTIHASIELFQNNTDLIPGTKDFDVELANKFADFAEPYELRVEGKLQGYSVPVQPIINKLRSDLASSRAAAAPAVASAGTTGATGPSPAAPVDGPQAGIQSKAGTGGEEDDYSTLFGTLGLPNLRI